MAGPADDARYLNLTGPFRALYRAARTAERERAGTPAQSDRPATPPDPIHTAVRRQVEALLADADIAPDRRQAVLDAIACPCCGGTGASFAISIKPASQAGF